MATEFKLPQLGEQVEKGVVLSVLVSAGDHVDRDEVVMELETDKATTEVPAPQSGTVDEVHVHEGDEVRSGDLLLTLEEDADESEEGSGAAEEADESEASESSEASEERSDAQADERREGAEEPREEEAAEKEEPQRAKEKQKKQKQKKQTQKKQRQKEARREPKEASRPARPGEPAPASPAVRRFARELGVDVSMVAGTDEGGRVTEEDVKSHVRELLAQIDSQREDSGDDLPDFSKWGEVERVPMSAIRRATAENVAHAWEHVPHVTQYDKADLTELETFRERLADEAEERGAKLTVTAMLVKVAAAALGRFPDFNASVDPQRGELIHKHYVNVGVAVDTDEGLLVPVLRDVDDKGLIDIAVELGDKADKARARKLSREELQGASFSITNLGGLGTTRFTPIVGWPQVAILSVGRMETRPVWDGDDFAPRKILPLGITYDHRAVDGADAARFLRWIAEALENPMRMTMES